MEAAQTVQIPQPAPKPRRVGTVTMGLALVAAGGVLLAGQFGLLNAMEVLRWSPAVLILLGIEILVGSALNKGGKMRYDFLSMIVCFTLIGLSALGSLIPVIIAYDRSYSDVGSLLSGRIEAKVAAAVGDSDIAGLDVHVWTYSDTDMLFLKGEVPDPGEIAGTLEENGSYSCDIYLELAGRFPDHEAFADKAAWALEAVAPLDLPVDQIVLSGHDPDGERYELYLDRYSMDLPPSELALQVQGNIVG
ncbi:MAG: hypothetical protein IKM31_05140 [Oscillospiraceae bacterium]|nr:hypothetical protein [Oscillospiraceae bacterium]